MVEALLKAYERGAEDIANAVAGVPEGVMAAAPSPDAWSIREILVHLSDAETVYAVRLRRALADEAAVLTGFDESAWGDRLRYAERDPRIALDLFRTLRRANSDLLRGLDAQDWTRTATHAERGVMTVADIVRALIDHAGYHLAQIAAIRDAHGLGPAPSG